MTWNVLTHGELEKLEDNLWCVSGTVPRMGLPRRMTVVKLADGRLVLHSVIALEEAAMGEIEAWGTPAFIVVPNRFHRLDAAAYAERYPEAKVVCPRSCTKQVEEVTAVHGSLDALPEDDSLRVVRLPGVKGSEAAFLVRHLDGGQTLLVNDVIFNLPHQAGIGGWITRLMGSSGGPKVTRIAKLMMVGDRGALAEELRSLAGAPGLRRLVMSHGDIVEGDAAGVLRGVADQLQPVAAGTAKAPTA